ncbi:MAG TPA: hypothetical protein VLB80_00075 [Candidatus Babeliales bacterium]|nr:hypothetical protein [Candidatus Babeliales bacterium]
MIYFPPPPPPAPIITVWIHGSKLWVHGNGLNEYLPNFLGKIAHNVTNALSDHKQNLHKITNDDTHYSYLQAKTLSTIDPTQFNLNHFYTFGWSGKLDICSRKQAAYDLFYDLKLVVQNYQKTYGVKPDIILISHSHGGNVLLHLAEIIDPDGFELIISKAILLACPIQKHTSHLINAPLFKKIYSLHSHADILQIIDLQGLHTKNKVTKPLFSERHFNPHPKLIQASICWKTYPLWIPEDYRTDEIIIKKIIYYLTTISYIKKNRGLFHIEFLLLPFIRQLPIIINQLDTIFEDRKNYSHNKNNIITIEL